MEPERFLIISAENQKEKLETYKSLLLLQIISNDLSFLNVPYLQLFALEYIYTKIWQITLKYAKYNEIKCRWSGGPSNA